MEDFFRCRGEPEPRRAFPGDRGGIRRTWRPRQLVINSRAAPIYADDTLLLVEAPASKAVWSRLRGRRRRLPQIAVRRPSLASDRPPVQQIAARRRFANHADLDAAQPRISLDLYAVTVGGFQRSGACRAAARAAPHPGAVVMTARSPGCHRHRLFGALRRPRGALTTRPGRSRAPWPRRSCHGSVRGSSISPGSAKDSCEASADADPPPTPRRARR